MFTGPTPASIRSAAASTDLGDRTSISKATPPSELATALAPSRFTSVTTAFAPRSANSRAHASPIPLAPPVTTAIRPVRRKDMRPYPLRIFGILAGRDASGKSGLLPALAESGTGDHGFDAADQMTEAEFDHRVDIERRRIGNQIGFHDLALLRIQIVQAVGDIDRAVALGCLPPSLEAQQHVGRADG